MQYQAQWIGHWYVVADWLEVLVGVVWQVVSVLLVAVVVGVGRGLRGKSCWSSSSWLWWWHVLLYDLHILALGCYGYVLVGWKGPCACLAWLHSRGVERVLCRPGFTRGKGRGISLNLRQRHISHSKTLIRGWNPIFVIYTVILNGRMPLPLG